ncbi:MAG: hypothetical protein AAGL68_06180 [Pseudomonadota bacterium]
MIVEISLFVLFAVFGLLAVMVFGLVLAQFRQGPAAISDLINKGFGIRAWLNGDMPAPDQSTSIDVIEGVEFEFDGFDVKIARQTRTISDEV